MGSGRYREEQPASMTMGADLNHVQADTFLEAHVFSLQKRENRGFTPIEYT